MQTNHGIARIPAIAGGTILSIIFNITLFDLVKTILLAALGTVVSYIVTLVLKRMIYYYKCWRKRKR